MQNVAGFDLFSLTFDENGKPTSSAELDSLKQRVAGATDVVFLAHGFRNSVADATGLYTRYLTSFRSHFARPEFQALGKCQFVAVGVYWPSLTLPEEFASQPGNTQSVDDDAPILAALRKKLTDLQAAAPDSQKQIEQAIQLLPSIKDDGSTQNKFAQLLLANLTDPQPDPTEGFDNLRNLDGVTILQKLTAPVILTKAAGSTFDTGGVSSLDDPTVGSSQSFASGFTSVLGGIDRFVNFTSWWIMKNRSGTVGLNGVAQAVRDLAAVKPSLKIHLVGHSLGGRLMAACAKSLSQDPIYHPASITLLEAAFSHFGFSADNGKGTPGFFRDVIAKKVANGPLIATFSAQDTVVGTVYSIASRLADDNVKAIGDANDPFGGIGHNGAVKTTESIVAKLKATASPNTTPYSFELGVVNCLDGSGGLIKDHGDVTNPDVTYAFACSVVSTQAAVAGSSS